MIFKNLKYIKKDKLYVSKGDLNSGKIDFFYTLKNGLFIEHEKVFFNFYMKRGNTIEENIEIEDFVKVYNLNNQIASAQAVNKFNL